LLAWEVVVARVVRFHELGGPEVLRVDQVEVGAPGPGEVRIKVAAIGLNRVEAMFRSGGFGAPPLPAKIGYEAAGVVEALGDGVTAFKVGDRVATLPGLPMDRYGVYGETILYPADWLIAQPDGLSLPDAAAAWMQYLTAYALIALANLKPDDAVVVTAASSSVGLAAIQIANMLGARPIAVTRGRGKVAALKAHGACDVVVTDEQELAPAVMALTGGKGARVIFDAVAGDTIAELAEAASLRGIIIVYGTLAGGVGAMPLQTAMMKSLTIRGYAMNDLMADPEVRRAAIDFITAGLVSGQLKPVIDQVFPLDQIAEAHRRLESNLQLGKILVTTD
jgi:NADPH:quinone reductase-like Zn-dependent oxidoreductase